MSPRLDMPLNRREAVTSLLAMLAMVMGVSGVDADQPSEMPELVGYRQNGIPYPSTELLAAFGAATSIGMELKSTPADPEPYRQVLRDALTIAERMTYEELRATFMGISRKRDEMACPHCYGFGEQRRYGGKDLGPCRPCKGTGLRNGGAK